MRTGTTTMMEINSAQKNNKMKYTHELITMIFIHHEILKSHIDKGEKIKYHLCMKLYRCEIIMMIMWGKNNILQSYRTRVVLKYCIVS